MLNMNNLAKLMPSERCQSQRPQNGWLHLYEMFVIETESRFMVVRVGGRERWKVTANEFLWGSY